MSLQMLLGAAKTRKCEKSPRGHLIRKSTLHNRLYDWHIEFSHYTSCIAGHRTQNRLTFCKSARPITITITIGCVLLQKVVIPEYIASPPLPPIIILVEIKITLTNDYCILQTHRCNISCTILDW